MECELGLESAKHKFCRYVWLFPLSLAETGGHTVQQGNPWPVNRQKTVKIYLRLDTEVQTLHMPTYTQEEQDKTLVESH